MPSVVGHELTLAEEAMAVFPLEADRLSQAKHCSLHALCVSLCRGQPLEFSCWARGVCRQPCETVLALTFLFCFSNFFCLLTLSSFKQT